MGNCCFPETTESKKYVSIKFPNSVEYITYNDAKKEFVRGNDISVWIHNLYYLSNFDNWVIYNDDYSKIAEKHVTKGHCKGIIAWSKYSISWLCHSVPNYPRSFSGKFISAIENSEKIYGQSFQYIEVPYTSNMLYNILHQIHIMEANIYINNYTSEFINYKNMIFPKIDKMNTIQITDTIIHIAKPPSLEIDIYGDYIAKGEHIWKVETWQRGHNIKTTNKNIIDINKIKFEDITFSESQDHSKWATSDDKFYFIGDLNRMTSQFKRGGGGFICNDHDIAKALDKLII